jgi:hypothetical protein
MLKVSRLLTMPNPLKLNNVKGQREARPRLKELEKSPFHAANVSLSQLSYCPGKWDRVPFYR